MTTNRKWLETLSDEEYSKETITQVFEANRQAQISAPITSTTEQINNLANMEYTDWLQAIHTTTADEDFAEIGFYPHDTGVTTVYWYKRTDYRNYIVVYKNFTDFDGIFSEYDVDRIRPIAEKKRKEVWG